MTEVHTSVEAAQASLLQQGISLPAQQNELAISTLFSSIPDTGVGNIGDIMGSLAAYIAFLEYKVSFMESDYEAWQQAYDFEKKRRMLTLEPERRDIMEAKADAELHDMIITVTGKYTQMKLLKAILEGKTRIFDSLSRELSRRSSMYRMNGMGV